MSSRPNEATNVIASYWGKARPVAEGAPFHLFACHSLDVIAVADQWLQLSPVLGRSLCAGQQPHIVRAWVRFFVGLHDIGKLDARFQAKAPHVVQRLAPDRAQHVNRLSGDSSGYDHGEMGYRWALAELDLYIRSISNDDGLVHLYDDAWRPWLAAVNGHHGALPKGSSTGKGVLPSILQKVDREARATWVATLENLCLAPEGVSLTDLPPSAPPLLAGFCSVADWLGSNTDYFPYADSPSDPVDYLASRADRARAVLRAAGLLGRPTRQGGMAAVFPERQPRQVQTLVDHLPRTAGLTLIEAPTGSGKTEAALSYAAYLLATNCADSVVFALPTQATANAMLDRLKSVAPRLFPECDVNIVMAHGKSQFNPTFIDLRAAAKPATVQRETEALVQCADWLAQSRKRAFLGQIGVCTIDQVLLSVLPVRHAFVRTLGIGRSVLIVDEVHAYDSYMYGLLEEVIRRQKAAGGAVVLLSATLPHNQRIKLAQSWGLTSELDALAPYPLVTHVDADGQPNYFQPGGAHQPESRSVRVELQVEAEAFPGDETCKRILAAARAGARVAVICNLVDHAQRLARLLREVATDIPIDIFHARYQFCDRQARELLVQERYGPNAPRKHGRVLVATQVVEQSLDLDFDWMVAQLCPVDLLFQRLGRLHRHARSRLSGFEQPKVSVLIPQEPDFGRHKYIYENVRVMWRTKQMLMSKAEIEFPAAYRDWIERVYAEEDWPDEPDEIVEAWDKWYVKQRAAWEEARQLASGQATAYDDDDRIQVFTRDGEMSLTVLPVKDGALWNGRAIESLEEWEKGEVINQHSVAVPANWKSFLPPANDGIYHLAMYEADDGWGAELGGGAAPIHRRIWARKNKDLKHRRNSGAFPARAGNVSGRFYKSPKKRCIPN
jgi:CRISPR-associated endonuclease/helicase Cas3